MTKEILPKHFIRVAASNELSNAEIALKNAEALILSQPFVCKTKNSIEKTIENYNKGFLIDPETYRYFSAVKHHFKGSKGNRKIRRWLADMANFFPSEIKDNFGKRAADIQNFDAVSILEFCQSNIEIQTSLTKENGDAILPLAIMAPYILIDSNDFSSKLLFQTQLINTTKKANKSNLPVVGILYISRDILNNQFQLNKIKNQLDGLTSESIGVWVDNFDETNATENELANLMSIYSHYSTKKHTLAMYGGMAQIMMMYSGLKSIVHGVHYQMHKTGLSNGGGPAHYFYIPNLRHRVRTIEASAIIRRQNFSKEEYCKKVCSCSVCVNLISESPGESIFNLEGNEKQKVNVLTEHFTFNKNKEIAQVMRLNRRQYVDWILDEISHLKLTNDEEEYLQTISIWVSSVLGIELSFENGDDEI